MNVRNKLKIHNGLDENTSLFRVIDIKQFLSIIEKQIISLTRIIEWEDPWEAPLRHLLDEDGNLPFYTHEESLYGQCWSTRETDALWRIYSNNKESIMLETKVKNFKSFENLTHPFIANVQYYDDLLTGINELTKKKYPSLYLSPFLKRSEFEHEKEVRFIADFQELHFTKNECPRFREIEIDPNSFIESITLDPRADDWLVETIKKYCFRANITCSVNKSSLYSDNVCEKTKIRKVFIPNNDSVK